MTKKKKIIISTVFLCILLVLVVGICLTNDLYTNFETLSEKMKDAVLHENDKVDLGFMQVNPAFVSAITVTGIILVFALIVRIFVIPKFKMIPTKFQLVLESIVQFFDNLAKKNSPHRHKFLSVYIFCAGTYIFVGTLFELIGIQVVSVHGTSVTLPAPLSDINGAIALGCLSYLIIMSGGIAGNGLKGVGLTLKDFSLPISMSFRLFGALLSGLLVTELVYYTIYLSIVLPVVIAFMFTILHALIQSYVLVMLTALFYGEVSEKHIKPKKQKTKKQKLKADAAS